MNGRLKQQQQQLTATAKEQRDAACWRYLRSKVVVVKMRISGPKGGWIDITSTRGGKGRAALPMSGRTLDKLFWRFAKSAHVPGAVKPRRRG